MKLTRKLSFTGIELILLCCMIIPYSTAAAAPVASFTINATSGAAPLIVKFTDTSSDIPTAWNWSFRNVPPGNNTMVWFSTARSITHTFGVGNYSIVLNASNSAGYNLSPQVTFINVSAFILDSITVTSPNGGESWHQDTTHSISWNYTGDPGPAGRHIPL